MQPWRVFSIDSASSFAVTQFTDFVTGRSTTSEFTETSGKERSSSGTTQTLRPEAVVVGHTAQLATWSLKDLVPILGAARGRVRRILDLGCGSPHKFLQHLELRSSRLYLRASSQALLAFLRSLPSMPSSIHVWLWVVTPQQPPSLDRRYDACKPCMSGTFLTRTAPEGCGTTSQNSQKAGLASRS